MNKWTAVIPTCRRPQHFVEHINWVLDTRPQPEKVIVTHPINDWTSKFNFSEFNDNDKVEIHKIENDQGLIHSKFTLPWELSDTDWLMVFDDDIFCGKKHPQSVMKSYKKKRGIYCGIGFRFGEGTFNKEVYGGAWRFDNYIKENRITLVDAPGQSFAFKKSDIEKFDDSYLPDGFGCNRCHDDLILGMLANKHNIGCYTTPHHEDKKEKSAVYKLKEGNLHTQSLVADNHPSDDHKDKFVKWLQDEKSYTRVEERYAH